MLIAIVRVVVLAVEVPAPLVGSEVPAPKVRIRLVRGLD